MSADDHGDRIGAVARTLAPDLLRYFERRVDPPADAADLVGETLLVLWRRADAVPRSDEAARMWAFGVARRVLDGYRRGRRRRLALADALRGELAGHPAPPSDDDALDVRRALDGLDARSREIVMLVAWDGFSLAEVARHLRLPEGTVRSRYSRARASLRSALGGVRAEPSALRTSAG